MYSIKKAWLKRSNEPVYDNFCLGKICFDLIWEKSYLQHSWMKVVMKAIKELYDFLRQELPKRGISLDEFVSKLDGKVKIVIKEGSFGGGELEDKNIIIYLPEISREISSDIIAKNIAEVLVHETEHLIQKLFDLVKVKDIDYKYFEKPTEIASIIAEIRYWLSKGFPKDLVYQKLSAFYNVPVEFIESLEEYI